MMATSHISSVTFPIDFHLLPKSFGTNCPCILKSGNGPALIKEILGLRVWKVVTIDPNGQESGTILIRKSQQIRKVKVTDSHPLVRFRAQDIPQRSPRIGNLLNVIRSPRGHPSGQSYERVPNEAAVDHTNNNDIYDDVNGDEEEEQEPFLSAPRSQRQQGIFTPRRRRSRSIITTFTPQKKSERRKE